MIKGIGTDILEISRMEKNINNGKFMTDYFTEKELGYILKKKNRAESAAAFFCGKEAVSKALGTGFLKFSPIDVEIFHDVKGKPYVRLKGNAQIIAESIGISKIHLSLTHCREYASAFAIAEGDDII